MWAPIGSVYRNANAATQRLFEVVLFVAAAFALGSAVLFASLGLASGLILLGVACGTATLGTALSLFVYRRSGDVQLAERIAAAGLAAFALVLTAMVITAPMSSGFSDIAVLLFVPVVAAVVAWQLWNGRFKLE